MTTANQRSRRQSGGVREGSSRTRTAARREDTSQLPRVLVWTEATLTICITADPPQFVKFTVGREGYAQDDDDSADETEQRIFEWCEARCNSRVAQLTTLINSINT